MGFIRSLLAVLCAFSWACSNPAGVSTEHLVPMDAEVPDVRAFAAEALNPTTPGRLTCSRSLPPFLCDGYCPSDSGCCITGLRAFGIADVPSSAVTSVPTTAPKLLFASDLNP